MTPAVASAEPIRAAQPIISAHDLQKRYGPTIALQGLTVTIPAGAVVGLFGPNGAGKTTFLKLVAGLAQADDGDLEVQGRRVTHRTRGQVAFVPDHDHIYSWMNVTDALDFMSRVFPDWNGARARRLADLLEVPTRQQYKDLSRGQRARVKLLSGLARDCPLVLLDEPLAAIDPTSRVRIIEALVGADRTPDQTILIATHEIIEAEGAFDYCVFIGEGAVRLAGEPEGLRQERGTGLRGVYEQLFQ